MTQEFNELERQACSPIPISNGVFNPSCEIPYGCAVEHIQKAMNDWSESGRSATSRRTPTASVLLSGYTKMAANWIYRDESLLTPAEVKVEPD